MKQETTVQKTDNKPAQCEPMQTEKDAAVKDVSKPTQTASTKPQEVKVSKKISLNRRTIEEAGEGEKEKAEEGESETKMEEKPAKKRKWGSKTVTSAQKPKKASSMPISTDSLKGLIPDIKPALRLGPEPILEDEMDYEDDTHGLDQMEAEDTRAVKIQRTVTQDVELKDNPDSPTDSEEEEEDEEGEASSEEEEGKKEGEKEDGDETSDRRSVQADGSRQAEGEQGAGIIKVEPKTPPAEKPDKPSKTVAVTKSQEKKPEVKIIRRLDSRSGLKPLIPPDEPEKPDYPPSPARNPVSKIVHIRNLVRPFTLPQLKELLRRTGPILEDEFWIDKIKSHCFVTYETEDDAVKTRKALHNTRWPSSNPKTLVVDFGSEEQLEFHRGDEKPIPPKKTKTEKDLRQEKLKAEREKEVERRRLEREKRMKERLEKEQKEKGKPVREWDREKKSREDWDRTMQRSRSRSPGQPKSQSPSKEGRRERKDRSKEHVERKEKKEEAQPAKLLDDLFRKTKATPCIYWLPLTEQEIAAKEKMGVVRPALRQKQEGDKVSPMRGTEGPERVERRRRTPSPARKLSRESPRGRVRPSPDRRRRDEGRDSRSRSGRRR